MDAAAYSRRVTPLLAQAGAYARSLLRNRSDAADAVQQAALRGWERIAQYDPQRPFKGWWFAIVRNCCFDVLRANQAQRTEPLEAIEPIEPRGSDPHANDLDLRALDAAMAQLSDAHRDILRLKYFSDLSYDELAEALAIPRGTVMSRLHHARKALAGLLAEKSS